MLTVMQIALRKNPQTASRHMRLMEAFSPGAEGVDMVEGASGNQCRAKKGEVIWGKLDFSVIMNLGQKMKTFVPQTMPYHAIKAYPEKTAERKGGLAAPAAGGDVIVSAHTIPAKEHAQTYCWIICNRNRNDPRSDVTL